MKLFLSLLALLDLGIIIYQDFKHRGIWILTLPLILVIFSILGYLSIGFSNILMIILINTLVVILILGLVFLYFIARKKSLKNVFQQYLGIGDVGFMVALTPAFSVLNYLLFLTAGFIFSLVTWVIVCSFKRNFTLKAPLAGLLALFLVFTILSALLKEYSFYNDNFILESLYKIRIN